MFIFVLSLYTLVFTKLYQFYVSMLYQIVMYNPGAYAGFLREGGQLKHVLDFGYTCRKAASRC